MDVDLLTSTIELAGRRLPACGLVCPTHVDGGPGTRSERALGQLYGHVNVYVPLESGVLVDIERHPVSGSSTFVG